MVGNRLLVVGLFVVASVVLGTRSVRAQVTGSVVGTVVDNATGQPVGGVTVILSGPQGEEGTATLEDGTYEVRALPIGVYVARFYFGDVNVEQANVIVSVDKTVRVNARMPTAGVETIKIVEKPPAVDIGSSRVSVTLNEEFLRSVPTPLNVGGILEKAPAAYIDPVAFYNPTSTGLSFNGTTGAEHNFILDGVNVSSVAFGVFGTDTLSPFVEEIEIITGGYNAEYGRALGGVVNIATKSGSNEFKGSAFTYLAPGFFAGNARRVRSWATSVTATDVPEFNAFLGAEVGGPIIKNKLFFWAGYAPEIGRSHAIRYVDRFVDTDGDGRPDGVGGQPVTQPLAQSEIPGKVLNHQYAGKLSYRLAPEHTLSLGVYGLEGTNEFMRIANADPRVAVTRDKAGRTDVSARWISKFFERRWQVEGNIGVHTERSSNGSPYPELHELNNMQWYAAPSLSTFDMSLAGQCPEDPNTGFKACPALEYQSGGYGISFDRHATRLGGQLKSSHLFNVGGWHQLKYGADYEMNQYENIRGYSGPVGSRAQVLMNDGYALVLTFFRYKTGERAWTRNDGDDMNPDPDNNGKKSDLLSADWYQDALGAKTESHNTAVFVQDSYSPLNELTINAGLRWEGQSLLDHRGGTAMSIMDSFAPRIGVIYDPTRSGRSKIYGQYGQFYESIPLDITDRAFGGEGLLVSVQADPAACPTAQGTWGNGNPATGWKSCAMPPHSGMIPIAGENLLVQRQIKGSYTEEVVLGAQYEVIEDLTIGAAYIKRWLGRVIEDAAGIIANPGDIPGETLAQLEAEAKAKEAAAAAPGATPAAVAAAGEARFFADHAKQAAELPKARRDYDALQLTAAKRLSKNWLLMSSYTYSQTRGNYPGLYAADTGQLDPNITSMYDDLSLLQNRDGPLPNDRPHIFRADGYYQHAFGKSMITGGLGAVARSGKPVNTLGSHIAYGKGESFILPRGSGGRTPVVTRFDLHLGFRTQLTAGTTLDAFVDIFNLFNQRTALTQDQNYTLDVVEPIIGGDARDLPHLKNIAGEPASRNPNHLNATAYQPPIAGRFGLRLAF